MVLLPATECIPAQTVGQRSAVVVVFRARVEFGQPFGFRHVGITRRLKIEELARIETGPAA